jgi:pSer/pThr/pTyr-binding forkhead associated (FHA) protein
MDRSRSKRQVLILDCCHSGAFAQGAKAVTGESAGTGPTFEGSGYGRVVLTATDATQYAWEGDKVIGDADNSLFTHFMVEGLRTGSADTDGDGQITLDEMYDYVYEQVVTRTPKQTPGKWSYKQQGDIIIARNPNVSVKPGAPPQDIFDTARRIAPGKAARLIVRQGSNPGAVYPLRAEKNTIGRNEGLEVTVRDRSISRRHTSIALRDGVYFIEDLLSINGTFVNSQKLTAPQPLRDGDQIAVGDTVLIFQQGETAPVAIADQPPSTSASASTFASASATAPSPPDQSQPLDTSLQPADITPSAGRAPKWVWIGIGGAIVLLLVVLLVSKIAPAADLAMGALTPESTDTEAATPSQSSADPLTHVRTNWTVVIEDSFDTNDNQWDTGDVGEPGNATGTLQIADGKYHWDVQAQRDFATVARKSHAPDGDFYASVDVQQVSGPATCGYGLLLRDTDIGLYQFALADHDQRLSIFAWKESQGTARDLINSPGNEAIHPGEANRLSVIAEGTHYQFFVNDQPVGDVTDADWTTGHVTLFVQLCQTGDSVILGFDNMELRTP